MEGRFEYAISASAASNDLILNLPRALSSIQQKGHGSTTADGTLLTYVCDVEFITTTENALEVYSARENWVTKNAFKKWHELRDYMFKESGLTKKERGRWSKIIRPSFGPDDGVWKLHVGEALYWDEAAEEWSDTDAALSDLTGSDWTLTEISVETNPDSPDTNLETDMFNLHICGPSIPVAGGDQAWTSVGMIESYMNDRAQPTAEPADPVSHRTNPLALLKGRSESSYDVLGIAALEAADGPPYDTSTDLNCNTTRPVLAGYSNVTSTGAITTLYNVRIPAGLALFKVQSACSLKVTVKRVEECRA